MKAPPVAFCSTAPLFQKLGIKAGSRLLSVAAPPEYRALLGPLPDGVTFERAANDTIDIVHVFVTRKEALAKHLVLWRNTLKPAAAVWVSWPKQSANVPTTVTEHVVRELALPLGFVDIKICSVSETWSGVKLVVRKTLR